MFRAISLFVPGVWEVLALRTILIRSTTPYSAFFGSFD